MCFASLTGTWPAGRSLRRNPQIQQLNPAPAQPDGTASQTASTSEAVERPPGAPETNPADRTMPTVTYEVLKLELVNSKWTLWQRVSWLTDIQVRITNTTLNRVIELTRFELESDPGPSWEKRPKLTQEQVDTLFREMMKRGESYGPAHLRRMDLQPNDSRTGWLASHAYLPYPARKGKPYCEFSVMDDEGEIYTLPIPVRGSSACAPPYGLMQLRNSAIEGRRMRERLNQTNSGPVPDDELRRFEAWTLKAADALESQPDYLTQFQQTLPSAAEPDTAQITKSTEILEEIVRILEGHMPA